MVTKKSVVATHDSALLELSAREVQTLMQRFGVPSQNATEQSELADMLLCLQIEAQAVVPAPQFVPLQRDCVH